MTCKNILKIVLNDTSGNFKRLKGNLGNDLITFYLSFLTSPPPPLKQMPKLLKAKFW